MCDVKKTSKKSIKNNRITTLPKIQKNVIKVSNDYFLIIFEVKCNTIYGERMNILTPKKVLQSLSIAPAQVKGDIISCYLFGRSRKRNYLKNYITI